MSSSTAIRTILPTPFLRQVGDALHQLAQVAITHTGTQQTGAVHVTAQDVELVTPVTLAVGESTLEVEVPEVTAPSAIDIALVVAGKAVAQASVGWKPPKRWVVHVVQLSHHDVGYTDLASHVLPEHDRWLDAVIDMAEATRDFPAPARFRMVIEQSWSIDHFLRHARPERVTAMLDLLRRGDVELTALFGNMVTELCGHETLARSVYHAFRLKREFGIPILSAEHNDIPGFSWGLSQVLVNAGVQLFCPGLPLYYNWGYPNATSFWDEAAIFGTAGKPGAILDEAAIFRAHGTPGAFWWEAPAGERVLFWCNNQGCGGDSHPDLPGLAPRLQELADSGYPYDALRWPVQGGARDNSPYIDGFARTIRTWNERWAYPRLVSSTNTRFYHDVLPQLPASLPVWRGELPGQDYPVGASSTAAATAVNRRNHSELPAAEALATIAGALTDYPYQDQQLFQAYEAVLWHDEHTWGHHFPAGPAARASEAEKALHVYRASAQAHDVANRAMARVADAVQLDQPGLHLVVFNTLGTVRSGEVCAPLREITNCASNMILAEDGRLCSATLTDRHHEMAPAEIVAGQFDLIDVESGAVVPYRIAEITSSFDTDPNAAQRLGLGKGGKRIGVFEKPNGLLCNLIFHAEQVPALGYRTYRFQPRETPSNSTPATQVVETALENQWYRLEIDADTGYLLSLLDKTTGREWVDTTAPHPFGALLVRDPFGKEVLATCTTVEVLPSSLRIHATAPGYPQIEIDYLLPAGEKYLEVAVRLLQDPTPLQEAYLAFPFHLADGRFRYQGPLCVVDPCSELLPGAFADRLAVQDWVTATGSDGTVLWSSVDAPVVSLGRLWPGRVSPAHSAVVRADIEHPRPDAETLRGGAIYSLLTANNFGTNFAVSQCGEMLFRYRIITSATPLTDSDACRIGRHFQTPLNALMTARPGLRPLPSAGSFLTIDHPAVTLVTLKQAEDGDGLMVRLWNTSEQAVVTHVALPMTTLTAAILANLAEEATGEKLVVDDHQVEVPLSPMAVVTVRLHVHGGKGDDQ